MAKKPSITTVASGYQSTTTINSNTQNLRDAFDNTLSLDGSTPNAMQADLDMNSNDIINVDKLYLSGLYLDGLPVSPGTLNYNGVIKETQIAISGQTIFNLTVMTYNPGINSLSVYVDGVYQNPSTYTETNSTRITFSAGLHVGAIVDFVALSINEITGAADASSLTYTPNGQSLYGSSTTVKAALDQISNQSTGSSKVGFLQSGTGVTNRTVQDKLRDIVSVKDFGAVGDGTDNDLAEIQAAVNSGAPVISVTKGTYNLSGGTLTVPAGVAIALSGGVLTNGTISCNDTFFSGVSGLSESITLTGRIINETGVYFDWFTCEKSTSAQYNTFINGNNATYGAVPTISTKNRTILDRLIKSGYPVQFGIGIYPFDAAIILSAHNFYISGVDRNTTLLWAPASSFLSYTSGGATYPYIKDIRIEAYNSVLKTQGNTVNAIHGLVLRDSFFTSYADHTFWNDYSIAGGTGCPIYGSKILNTHVYAGPGKGCFYGWGSGSNVFDNVCDLFIFFNGININRKGIANALFWNSNVRSYCNSNISYAGLNYVARFDRSSTLNYFYANNNVFESNTNSFQAIVKADDSLSNLFFGLVNNFYIGNVAKENGYAYILTNGNTYVQHMEANATINSNSAVLYGNNIRNFSDQYICAVTTKTDTSGTQYRLVYYEPHSADSDSLLPPISSLLTPSANLADLVGMRNIYDADSANISFIQVNGSRWSINGNALGVRASGTTANRPTSRIYPGYPYYDTTLNKPIVYDGTNWRDGAGTIV